MPTSHTHGSFVRAEGIRSIITMLALCFMSLMPTMAYGGDVERMERSVDFVINSAVLMPDYADNARALDEIVAFIDAARTDTAVTIEEVALWGAASPDGGLALNDKLSVRRMEALKDYITAHCDLAPGVVKARQSAIPWATFRQLVASRPFTGSSAVLEIISDGDDSDSADVSWRLDRLRQLDGGRAWRIMVSDIFPRLRKAFVVAVRVSKPEPIPAPAPQPEPCPEPVVEPEVIVSEPEPEPVPEPMPVPVSTCSRGQWWLKTNVPALGAAVANVAGEWALGCRWSVALSWYYSAWNYGEDTRKFRTFTLRPEVRRWFSDGHNGFFVEAHLAMSAFNFAMPGWEYRIQDRGGRHPALGGGIGAGYRLRLSRDGRWRAEAAVGAGVYHLDYDRFVNRANGPLHDNVRRTWIGIDNVAISIVYTLNLAGR